MRRHLIRIFWYGVAPALAAALLCRCALPSPAETRSGSIDERFALLIAPYPAALLAASFLALTALVRYWREWLPGARSLVELEPDARGARLGLFAVAVGAGAAALAVRHGAFEVSRVLSCSMLPGLAPGDQLAVNKLAYSGSFGRDLPRRGDVIAFRRPPGAPGPEHLIKRVIGLPGDRIGMRGSRLVINGWDVPTCDVGQYADAGPGYAVNARLVLEFLDERAYLTLYTPLRRAFLDHYDVAPGEVFVLGDNRNDSQDSRSWNDGRGAGLRSEVVDGRVERLLAGARRDGNLDLGKLLGRPGLELRLEGVDTRELRDGIRRCLAARPAQTTPPPPTAR